MKTTKQAKPNLVRQSEPIEDEMKELDLQLEELRERRAALSQALLMAKKDEREGQEEPSGLEPYEDVEEIALKSLPWRPFGPGKKGEWTFATDMNGNLITQLERSHSFVSALRERSRVDRGGYHYRISQNGRFLHRFPADN